MIMSFDLEPYRTALSMPEILSGLGMIVNGSGMTLCPGHDEKHPSCKVYLDHVYCFSCGFHQDTIGIVQHVQDCDFWGALEWIADRAGIPRQQRDPASQKRYEAIHSISQTCSAVIHDALAQPEPALACLESRGISRATTEGIVGYLPANYQPADPESAKRAGCYSTKGNFLFSGRLIIPIMQHGQIVSLYGRSLEDSRIPKHIYPSSTDLLMPVTLWNLDACRKEKGIYLVESIIDALTLIDRGFKNTATLFGTQGLTDARLDALKRTHVEKVTLCFDSDLNGSGQQAALKTGERLFRAGYEVEIINLPLNDAQGKADPNSYFQDHTADDFLELPRRDFFDCLLDSIPREASTQQRYKALAPILKMIAEQPELTWKEYVSAINKRFPEYDRAKLGKEIAGLSKEKIEQQERSKRFLPLAYVDQIRSKAPVICFDGKHYSYESGVYRLIYPEEIDQQTIELIGEETQGSHLDAVRKFLGSVCFVRPETVNPRGILNLKNGLLNLESGSLELHNPGILSTVQAETAFDPATNCPLWLQTVEEILPDPESRNLLAQIFGYCMTPDNSFQKGFILYGEGSNGKSVITDILEALVGRENCAALHLSDFKERFRLAELQNRLVNFSTEVEARGLVNDAKLKGIITGDPITAERKNQAPFVFRPFVKLIVSCNNLPRSTDKSHGYFRRWIILLFTVTFPPEKWDRGRAKRIIETELSGVLNWAIGGYKSLKDAGHFAEPSASKEALQEYKRQTDPVIDFVQEHVKIFQDMQAATLLKDLYPVYRSWTKDNGYEPLGRNNFSKAFERATGKTIHKTEFGMGFHGTSLI